MSKVKSTVVLLVRLSLACVVMVIAYIISTMVMGQTDIEMPPEAARQAGSALIWVSLISTLVLSFLILRSPWYGLKLIGAVALVHFGIETFMAQIETFYFNSAIEMGIVELWGIQGYRI